MANQTKGVNLHEVRAEIPDDPDARAAFDFRLKGLTWAQMVQTDGLRRVILVNELGERGVMIDCRVNLGKLRQRIPDAEELVVEGPHPQSIVPNSRYAPQIYTFTERWQPLTPAVAFWFHQMQEAKPELGAEFFDDGYYKQRNQEGEIVLNWREVRVPKVKGILEFRAPADRLADGATTPGGIALTRLPDRLPQADAPSVGTGLPRGMTLDDVPLEAGEPDATFDPLAELARAAGPIAPTSTPPDDDTAPPTERAARRSPARKPTA